MSNSILIALIGISVALQLAILLLLHSALQFLVASHSQPLPLGGRLATPPPPREAVFQHDGGTGA
ncbi:hypothetical protein SAMN05216548_10727 [Faunimonas pinastri]|uniref:Uncharacterized protein n=1 Tax=Faunimonas pinastri TaxID=1855383 RepID=A0A1H9I9F8_9HYPH|nr:hypothetical protein [Faunimonas pinastri]SEQ71223.1 hypothetical protein SAMN05216548_10727 [Faunimonas pinastri]